LIYIASLNDHFTAKYLFAFVENETLNQRVPGSSPGAPTKQIKHLSLISEFWSFVR